MTVTEATEPTAGSEHRAPRDPRAAVGMALVATAAVVALVWHSDLFLRVPYVGGDHMYHRGVANGLRGGGLVGDDFWAGHLSYFSGPWHLAFAWASTLLDRGYDALLVWASWLWGPIWVGALALLGRRLWRDWMRTAAFVVLGAFAAPFSTDYADLWVEGLLPGGHAFFPLYPRDLAFVALVLAAWAVLSDRRAVRVVVAGLLAALALTTHPQIGVLTSAVVGITLLVRPGDAPRRARVRELLAAAGVVLLASLWWLVPQGHAILFDGPLLLDNYPGRVPIDLGPRDYLRGFGLVGLLAVPGAWLAWRTRAWRDRRVVLVVWIAVVVPFMPIARVTGDAGFFTERRLWLLLAIPIVALAVEAVGWATDRLPPVAAGLLTIALVLPTLPGLLAHRDVLASVWSRGPVLDNGLAFDRDMWTPVWGDLAARREDGPYEVITYDEYGSAVWSFTGAPVLSLWMPGTYKVGYDPDASTGSSIAERAQRQQEAFIGGRGALCALADDTGTDAFVLDRLEGAIGTRDVWAGTRFRPDRVDRTEIDLERDVGEGLTYVDYNNFDTVRLDPGARFDVEFPDAELAAVRVALRNPNATGGRVVIEAPGVVQEVAIPPGLFHEVVVAPTAPGGAVTIRALDTIELGRVQGFEVVAGLEGDDGPVLLTTGELCP